MKRMNIIICPGIHGTELTDSFVNQVKKSISDNYSSTIKAENIVIFPSQNYPAYSAFHILQFLEDSGIKPLEGNNLPVPLLFISFSAGVVGALGAAWTWQAFRGKVKGFIALDGWGVPLTGDFPIHRMSHDHFTHWSSALLGSGEDSFYADPPVGHLELWRSPLTTSGWWVNSEYGKPQVRSPMNAAQFLTMLLERYAELEEG